MNTFPFLSITFFTQILWSIFIGIVIGYLYFSTLRWNISLLLKSRAIAYAIVIQIIRIGIATSVLFICISFNMSALAVLIGFLLARWIVIHQHKKV